MRWLPYKRVAFTSVHMDIADIRKRSKAAHVTDLAQSIREHGAELIHAPLVRMPGKRLVCGRDRMAALLTLKTKSFWARMVECTDEEAADLEAVENIHRRNDSRADVLAHAVNVKEQLLRSREVGQVSHPAKLKGEARKAVASEHGVSTAAVRKAEQRSAAAKVSPPSGADTSAPAAKSEDGVPAAVEVSNLDLLGCNDASGEAVAKFALKDQQAIDEADKYLRLAQTALARMNPGTVQQQLHAQVHRVASLVRSHRPASLCPWCKGLPKADVGMCVPCAGAGYVSEEVKGRAPKELTDTAVAPLVAMDGKMRIYADVKAGKWRPGNGATKAGKRITVTKADGTEADLDEEIPF